MAFKLLIDQRETLKESFSSNDDTFQILQLEVGDYHIVRREDITAPCLVIERKTVMDWIQSIKDGRYKEQKLRLQNLYSRDSQILFLVEGRLPQEYVFYSTLLNTMFRDQFHVFHTSNANESVLFLKQILQKFEKGCTWLSSSSPQMDDNNEYSNAIIKQMVPRKKENITKEQIYLAQLCCIPGISQGIARGIMALYPTMAALLREIQRAPCSEFEQMQILPDNSTKKRKLGKIARSIYEAFEV